MTLTSRMAAAEDGLLFAMNQQTDLAGLTQLGDPGTTPPAEVVWITENAMADWNPDTTASDTNAGTFEEIYELHVRVLVMQSGNDYQTIRDRAMLLSAAVEEAVASYRTLNGAVEDSYVVHLQRSTGVTGEGRGIDMEITVRARSDLA